MKLFQQLSLLVLLLGLVSQPLQAQTKKPSSQPTESLMTKIRRFIGTQKRMVSVGAARGDSSKEEGLKICLLSPGPIIISKPEEDSDSWKYHEDDTDSWVYNVHIVDPSPVIVIGSPLAEIKILKGINLLWEKETDSTSTQGIQGRISWPLPPVQVGEVLRLAMRPYGKAAEWAVVKLNLASVNQLKLYKQLSYKNGKDHDELLNVIQDNIDTEPSIANALFWKFNSTSIPLLKQIGKEALQSCSSDTIK